MARETETRAISLVDLPTIRRLGQQAMVLDSAIEFTQGVYEPNTATLTNFILPNRSVHTLIARSDKQQAIGQFRLRADHQNAHIVYIAPELEAQVEDTVWLHVLDAMAREAGQYEAHALVAEVREDSCLFETMRTAGYAVYSRRQIWKREAHLPLPEHDPDIEILPEAQDDSLSIQSLIAQIVPQLMQPFVMPSGDMNGWVFRQDEHVMAYVSVITGKLGIYMMPFIHPDIMNRSNAILNNLIHQIPRSERVPVYICVSRYMDWIASSLEKLDFEPGIRQAVMVKHITAGVRQASFRSVQNANGVIAGGAKPPTLHSGRRLELVDHFSGV